MWPVVGGKRAVDYSVLQIKFYIIKACRNTSQHKPHNFKLLSYLTLVITFLLLHNQYFSKIKWLRKIKQWKPLTCFSLSDLKTYKNPSSCLSFNRRWTEQQCRRGARLFSFQAAVYEKRMRSENQREFKRWLLFTLGSFKDQMATLCHLMLTS